MAKVMQALTRQEFHDTVALRILPEWFEIETRFGTEHFPYGQKQVRLLDSRTVYSNLSRYEDQSLATFLYFQSNLASIIVEIDGDSCLIAVNRLPVTDESVVAG